MHAAPHGGAPGLWASYSIVKRVCARPMCSSNASCALPMCTSFSHPMCQSYAYPMRLAYAQVQELSRVDSTVSTVGSAAIKTNKSLIKKLSKTPEWIHTVAWAGKGAHSPHLFGPSGKGVHSSMSLVRQGKGAHSAIYPYPFLRLHCNTSAASAAPVSSPRCLDDELGLLCVCVCLAQAP
jgi:hypothetical protein